MLLKKDNSARATRLRQNNVKSTAREVQPRSDDYKGSELDYNLQTFSSKKIQKIKRNQRQLDD